jgi:thiol-disulfide isomerase/thioredoxin/DNA-binding beta-propeller fold protein YncE
MTGSHRSAEVQPSQIVPLASLSTRHHLGLRWLWLFGWLMAATLAVNGLSHRGLLGMVHAQAPEDEPPAATDAKRGDKRVPPNPFPRRVPAVELDGGVEWLNAAGPISLKDLRGKVVLLDFWTFCCINCMHVLPDLAFLEEKYAKELVVIGVHSAKFDNERETGNIRKAILRYEIAHPVVNDAQMILWQKFGVRSWPTLVLIDPEGFYCGYLAGEGHREALDEVIGKVVEYHRAKGTLDETPVRFDLERNKQPATPLKFPGKILADTAGQRLFISDSNHNRIVVTSLTGELLDVIGSGVIGRKDGSYAEAQFDHPQGMCLYGNRLYIADTENHLIRSVDLTDKTVSTLAGTGKQGYDRQGGNLKTTSLASPWDLLVLDEVLYIAMAGPHQLWSHRFGSSTLQPYAGTGREDIRNGPLDESALAQPSGLATDGSNIFVCDSEGSSIRVITTIPKNNLKAPKGLVTTLAGASDLPNGRSLFENGDIDGQGANARLQHPLGIVYHNDTLFIADSYNHKIKTIDPKTGDVATWLGTGKAGDAIDPPSFGEPAGLTISGDQLYVADTNNHRICVINLQTKAMSVMEIPGLKPPETVVPSDEEPEAGMVEVAPSQQVLPGDSAEFEVELQLPDDHKLNPLVEVTYRLTAEGEPGLLAPHVLGVRHAAEVVDDRVRFSVPITATSGQGVYRVAVTYAYCREGKSGLCRIHTAQWNLPLEVTESAQSRTVSLKAPPPAF